MAWQMPGVGQWTPAMGMPQDMSMAAGYTPEQWAALQQQNWQQWTQWQQQYSQWQSQFGEKYAKQVQAGQAMPGMPPLPVGGAAPAPPPPDQPPPPPPPHENNQPLYGNSQTPAASASRNTSNLSNTNSAPGNNQWSYGTDAPKEQPSAVNREALNKLAEEEKSFDIQFQKWEEEIERWRKENVNHPDKETYKEYEERFELCRAQLLERRKQMQLKRTRLLNNVAPLANTTPGNKSTPVPAPSNHTQNYNQNNQTQNLKNNTYQQDSCNQPRSSNKNIDPQDRFESYDNMKSGDAPPQRNSYSGVNSDPAIFLQTSSAGKSIPGLDLVPEPLQSKKNHEVIDISDEPNEMQQPPDYSTISKGINNILGDAKIMNILSMVQVQGLPSANAGQNAPPNVPNNQDYPPNQGNRNQQNQNMPFNRQGPNFPMQQSQGMNSQYQHQDKYDGRHDMQQDQYDNGGMSYGGNNRTGPDMRQGTPGMRSDGFDMRQGGNMRGGSNMGLGGPNMGHSGPGMRQGGPDMWQGRQDMSHSGPNMRQGGPNMYQGRSDIRHGPGGPNMGPGGPNMSMGGPSMGLGPNMGQGGGNMGHGGPNMVQGGPNMGQGGPNMGQTGPNMSQTGPNMGQGGSNMGQGRPNMGQAGPNMSQSGLNMGQTGPNMGQGGPNMGQGGPNMGQGGPNMGQGRPNMGQGGPNMRQGGQNMHQGGPDMQSNLLADMRRPGPNNQGNNNSIQPLMSLNPRQPLQDMGSHQNVDSYYGQDRPMGMNEPPVNQPARVKWVEEPLFAPSIVVDYEHKPLRLKAREFIEPVHTFDYNHRSKDEDNRNKKKDFDKEVEELFTRMPRKDDSDGHNKDLFFRDYERRGHRDNVRDVRDTRDFREEYRREELRDDFRGMKGPRDMPRELPREDFERRRYDDRYDDRRRDEPRDFMRRDERREDRRDDRKDDRRDDRDRFYGRRDDIRDRERDREPYRSRDDSRLRDDMPRDDRYKDRRDDRKDEHKNRSKSKETDSRKRGLSKENDPSAPAKKTKDKDEKKHVVMIDDLLEPPGRDMRPEKLVIILRGLPGSGKSYLAKLIRDREAEHGGTARIMSIDDYFMQEGETEEKDPQTGKIVKKPFLKYEYDESAEDTYMTSLKRAFKRSMTDGYFNFLIYDAVNDQLKHYADIWNHSRQGGFQVYVCTMEADIQTCFKRNIHNRNLEDIEVIKARFFDTPSHHIQLDATTLLQSASIQEVHMEDVEDDVIMEDVQEVEVDSVFTSKWEKMDDVNQLARLDGTSKPLRPSQLSMEEYLQLDDWKPNVAKPGKKTVRWADIEERREQEKMRAIGFVVGQTDWDRMNDPTMGSAALTQTKFIERVRRQY